MKIHRALISVYHKDKLLPWAEALSANNVELLATDGTYQFLNEEGFKAKSVESLTGFPSIFGGRIKTLHPKIMGGILFRPDNNKDIQEAQLNEILPIDLVLVDLYPFEQTMMSTNRQEEIIEKIDIGGISMIRAAAKNFRHVSVIADSMSMDEALEWYLKGNGSFSDGQRLVLATRAFALSSRYDAAILSYFSQQTGSYHLRIAEDHYKMLRYGENPHQKGIYFGRLNDYFTQLHGKEISYNNLLDIDTGLGLISEFDEPTIAIIKHSNSCGIASHKELRVAWERALEGDPVSAFGGVVVSNKPIDKETASQINSLFIEVIMAPAFENEALQMLKSRKNRVILQITGKSLPDHLYRTAAGGFLMQDRDKFPDDPQQWECKTHNEPTAAQIEDMLFANKIVKHLKSNAIALVKKKQLIGMGAGQTSRVDALRFAIEKSRNFGFDLRGAVMASDAFFPFADSVELAHEAGIDAIIQPGGSIKDQESIDFCNQNDMVMIFTGIRHFKH
ncbi:MAG TPA: bifunctional phosphoribosylaminoimidazolecarboxamide formyltransferase/IMP cyclohydrolase [Bacteroidales bacterium]|jgi:phosphoribosylaminoimidazolecarboxamide formyltransferase/IMP cyclohydrolase|nr:bifunctional phosphoribosylaminoimidazolecarboxamide formyltransferase/IMP cyclohydrolase [Bacteroidales bacterium]